MSLLERETPYVLTEAKALLERGWCRFAEAQDAEGNTVSAHDPKATRWCVMGALMAAAGLPFDFIIVHPAYHHLSTVLECDHLNGVNDRAESVEPILELFDRAISTFDNQET